MAAEDGKPYTAEELTPVIKAIIDEANDKDEDISLKQVRRQVEKRLGLEEGHLDPQRDLVKEIVQKVVDEADAEAEEVEMPLKRAKTSGGPKRGAGKAQAKAMTQAQFLRDAKPMKFNVNDGEYQVEAKPRIFGTGSSGWHFGTKQEMKIGDGDTALMAMFNFQVTIIGSKQWEEK
jgi:hypothetical protein